MHMTKYGSQLFIVLEQVTVHLRQVQNALTRMGSNVADKSRKLKEAADIYLWQLYRRRPNTLTIVGRSVADKPRGLQKALRSSENELRELLASPLDAIVVTNADGSLIDANSKALDLFGITRTNMRQFTIGVFLSHSQIQQFDGKRLPFARRETRRGKCEIQRLDGGLRVVEYSFVGNVTPFRNLCSFRSATATDQYLPAPQRTIGRKSGQ